MNRLSSTIILAAVLGLAGCSDDGDDSGVDGGPNEDAATEMAEAQPPEAGPDTPADPGVENGDGGELDG